MVDESALGPLERRFGATTWRIAAVVGAAMVLGGGGAAAALGAKHAGIVFVAGALVVALAAVPLVVKGVRRWNASARVYRHGFAVTWRGATQVVRFADVAKIDGARDEYIVDGERRTSGHTTTIVLKDGTRIVLPSVVDRAEELFSCLRRGKLHDMI